MPEPTSHPDLPRASLVIVTRNRRKELQLALTTALTQTVVPQIIVMDDGSNDGTEQMMRDKLPRITYERFGGGNGPCVLRNRGTQLASAPIVFYIDDDASFASPRTIEQTLAFFAGHERIVGVAIPFIDTRRGNRIMQQPLPGASLQCISAFIGAAHAVRRDVYLKVGGYREIFYYQHEESDLCLRLLAAGHPTVMIDVDPLHHTESPSRSQARADYYSYRNLFVFTWINSPIVNLLPMLVGNTIRGLSNTVLQRRPITILRGVVAGPLWIFRHPFEREPVPSWAFRLFRRLRIKPIPYESIQNIIEQQRSLDD